MSRRACALNLGALALAAVLSLIACGRAPTPEPTPDYTVLETQVAVKLAATLTAKAPPTPTRTPAPVRPTSTSVPRPTATPTLAIETPVSGEQMAFVRILADDSTNITLSDESQQFELLLTHFVEAQNMCDLDWTADGQALVFVSAHDFVHSRANERNVFVMRADGTGLHMVTGDYLDPQAASGPYVTVQGTVIGCAGVALVSAQGVPAAVATDAAGAFELVGVPVSARWARAVCPGGAHVLQGDIDLSLVEGLSPPLTLEVRPTGQGWTQAALAPDGKTLAGIAYRWVLDPEGEQEQTSLATLLDTVTGESRELALPEGSTITSITWTPAGDAIIGALSGSKGASLRRWDAQGNDLGQLLLLANPDDIIYSIHDVTFSPSGDRLAFSLKSWDWWGDERYKADLMLVSADGQNPVLVVESEWGTAASHPTWADEGRALYYQTAVAGAGNGCSPAEANILRVHLPSEGEAPVPEVWRDDGKSSLPAVRPHAVPTPIPTADAGFVTP